ncbi:MAG: hypothetical protein AB8H79_08135 [Myxococcota bacterium]
MQQQRRSASQSTTQSSTPVSSAPSMNSAEQAVELDGAAVEESTPTLEAAGAGHSHGADSAEEGPDVAPPVIEKSGKKGPLSGKRGVEVLNDAFKGYKKIDMGNVQILEQAAFQVAYEKVYGKSKFAWAKWVVPTHGNLNGFAHKGVNYINKSTANTGTVPHEILHSNAAADWRPFVDNPFDEGATDVLKQYALKKAGLSSPNSYPNQIACVEAFLSSGVSRDDLFKAYLVGGASTIVGKHVDDNCKGSWTDVKTAMRDGDWAKAKVKLGKK